MSTRETVQVGKTYYIEHRRSTMATVATVLAIDGDTVQVSGDAHKSSYLYTLSDYRWTEHK